MNPLSWIGKGRGDRATRARQPVPETRLKVANLTRETLLATCMEVAESGPNRNKGLLGRASLSPGEGLWIIPCEAVHTFWMQFPIDLVYLDRKKRIKKLRSSVPPWRLSACLSAHSILELPSGTIQSSRTEIGDTLEFSSAPLPESRCPIEIIERNPA
jgi:uncharacterized membrane protein (UPF0127 family)